MTGIEVTTPSGGGTISVSEDGTVVLSDVSDLDFLTSDVTDQGDGTVSVQLEDGAVSLAKLSADTKQAVNTVTIPNTQIADGDDAIGLRFNIPAGKTLKIWALGVQNDSNSTPTDLDIRVRDETNGTNIVDQNQAYNEGTPIASKDGDIDVKIAVQNDTGSQQNASGWVSFTVEG